MVSVKDLQEVFQFQSKVSGLPVEYFETLIKRDPWFEPENILTLSHAGKLVNHLQIFPKPVRVGGCSVMAGGIGNVATLPKYRRRGYATKLLEEAIQLMKERGYGFSILFTGIPHFYRELKWGVACSDYEYSIPTAKICDKATNSSQILHSQNFQRKNLTPVMRMYELVNRGRTLSVVRSRKCWRLQLDYNWNEDPKGFLLIKKRRVVEAYARCVRSRGVLEVVESGYLPNSPYVSSACRALLIHLGRYAREANLERISASVPPDHLLTKQLLDYGASNLSRVHGSLMVRIIDLKGLIEKILTELSDRIRNLDFSGRVRIKTEEDEVSLQIKDNEVHLAEPKGREDTYRTSHRVLAQHLTGHLSPREAFNNGLSHAKPSVVKVIHSLFRTGARPHMWKSDRF